MGRSESGQDDATVTLNRSGKFYITLPRQNQLRDIARLGELVSFEERVE
jgi:transcription elongation factor